MAAIADGNALTANGSAIEEHAHRNTTSLYTVPETISMVLNKQSIAVSSLTFKENHLATVIAMVLDAETHAFAFKHVKL